MENKTQTKSVLLISPQPFFLNRGTPINVRAMSCVLAQAGYQVDLLVYSDGEDVELPAAVKVIRAWRVPGLGEVPIGPSWKKIVLDPLLFIKALYLVLTRRYAVLHGVEEGGCIAGVLSFLKRVPYVFDMDSCMPRQLEDSGFIKSRFILDLVAKIEAFFVRRASATLTVCHALTEKARAISENVPVYQIEDFPPESAAVVQPEIVERLKQEFACASKRVVLYTGNFEAYQGIGLLLEGFAELCAKLKEGVSEDTANDVILLLVGGGALTSPQTEYYRQRAGELGIGHKVQFAGSRPGEQMGSFMGLADVLVSPRIEGENTPLKLYGYMAASKPIVATRIVSHTQVLDDESAFLFEPDADSLATALYAALDDSAVGKARREKTAEKAKFLVESRYSLEEFSRRLLEMYMEVIGPADTSAAVALAAEEQADSGRVCRQGE